MRVNDCVSMLAGVFKNCISIASFSETQGYSIEDEFNDNGARVEMGATKMCIIPYGDDRVVKIPFSRGSNFALSRNYCHLELETYQMAKKQGVEEFFAEIEMLTEVSDMNGQRVPVYVQEKADVEAGSLSSYQLEKLSPIYSKSPISLPFKWLWDAVNAYGEEKIEKFFNFLLDEDINDIHNGNVGYISGRPVLIDYSGYYENFPHFILYI